MKLTDFFAKLKTKEGRKKLKYGSSAIVFTVAVVALVIIANVIITALARKNTWWIDMTDEQYFTLSEESIKLLDDKFEETDKEVSITFCTPLDKLQDNYFYNMIYQSALEYQARYDSVKVDYIDIFKHPKEIEKYKTTQNSVINDTTVLISTDDHHTSLYFEDFFAEFNDSSYYAAFYKGEMQFTSAILSILSDKPVVYFVNNHEELTGKENSRPALWKLFETAGYEVRETDLLKEEEFDPNSQILVFNGPKKDLVYGRDVDEPAKVQKLLDSKKISVMVFLDPSTDYSSFPELSGLLEDWGGIRVEEAVIRDEQSSISHDGKALVVFPSTEDPITGALTQDLISRNNMPKIIADDSVPLTLLWKNSQQSQQKAGEDSSMFYQGSLIKTSDTAVAYSRSGEESGRLDSPFDVITITNRKKFSSGSSMQEEEQTYMFVCGTTEFAKDEYLGNPSYANDEIMYTVMRMMGKKDVPIGVKYKSVKTGSGDDVLDITQEEANDWTARLTLILPLISVIAGTVVQIRRKHL